MMPPGPCRCFFPVRPCLLSLSFSSSRRGLGWASAEVAIATSAFYMSEDLSDALGLYFPSQGPPDQPATIIPCAAVPPRRRAGRGFSAADSFPNDVSAGAGPLLLRVPQQPQDVLRSLVGLAKHGHGRLGNHLVPGKLAEFRGHVGVANHRFGRGQFLPRNGEAAEL